MPKKGWKLPDGDHIMRHIPWSKLRKDENDNVLGFLPQAFQLRPQENSLSVNWLEFFDGNHAARTKKLSRNCVKPSTSVRKVLLESEVSGTFKRFANRMAGQ